LPPKILGFVGLGFSGVGLDASSFGSDSSSFSKSSSFHSSPSVSAAFLATSLLSSQAFNLLPR